MALVAKVMLKLMHPFYYVVICNTKFPKHGLKRWRDLGFSSTGGRWRRAAM
jgi:hypothetical protein